jgi:hypothetical protein
MRRCTFDEVKSLDVASVAHASQDNCLRARDAVAAGEGHSADEAAVFIVVPRQSAMRRRFLCVAGT